MTTTAKQNIHQLSCAKLSGVGIPGSHKANVGLPAHYRKLDDYIDENVRPIGCRAGDCIIFTEALSEPFFALKVALHEVAGLTLRLSFVVQRTGHCRGHWKARRVPRSSTNLTRTAPPGHATTSTRRTLVRACLHHCHYK